MELIIPFISSFFVDQFYSSKKNVSSVKKQSNSNINNIDYVNIDIDMDNEKDFIYRLLFDFNSRKGHLIKGIYPQFISNICFNLFLQTTSVAFIFTSFYRDTAIKNIYENLFKIVILNFCFLNIYMSLYHIYLYYFQKNNKKKIIENYLYLINSYLMQFMLCIIFAPKIFMDYRNNNFYFSNGFNLYNITTLAIFLTNTYDYIVKNCKNLMVY